MGFDLKKCLERDGGKCYGGCLRVPYTLLYDVGGGVWMVTEGHIDREMAHGTKATLYRINPHGLDNLPTPPRKVKLSDLYQRAASTMPVPKETHDYNQAVLAAFAKLGVDEIELPPEK